MTTEASKAERERLLDEKIKMMRAKNAAVEQRKREVDRDKAIAEINKSSVTVAPKPKYEIEPSTTPDRVRPKPRRPSDTDGIFDQPHQQAPPPVQQRLGQQRPRTSTDPSGPPPDPGYRFLADRMRDDDDGGGKGKLSREEALTTSKPARRVGGAGGAGAGKPRDRLQSNKEKIKEQDDDCILVSVSDRKGNVISYYGDNLSKQEDRKSAKKSEAVKLSGALVSPSTPKIKSLFDEDDGEYYFPERWKGKEHHPKIYGDPQRKIEHNGGKLLVTKTIDPVARLESEYANPTLQRQELKNVNLSSKDSEVVESDLEWLCGDPACGNLNPPFTSQCACCKLMFSKSVDYKSNLACDKYKQEFRRQPMGMQQIPPPPADLIAQQTLPETTGSSFASNGLLESQPQIAPQFYPADVSSWQGQEYSVANSEWTVPPPETSDVATSWPSIPQDMVINQNYGIMVNQLPVQGFPPSSNFYEPQSRQMDSTNQYYSPEFVANPYVEHNSQFTNYPPQTNQFNPVAQAFVPTTTTEAKKATSLFQTPPPPIISGVILNRPPPPSNKSVESTLLVPLSSPPKPLRMMNRLDSRKHARSPRTLDENTSTVHSRLSEKHTQKLPPRLIKSREAQPGFKPPSLFEMQSGSLKHGSIPPPPPQDKGVGLLLFGTSNVVNNLEVEQFSKMLKIPVRLIPAMKLEVFQSVVSEVDPSRDWLVLIHGLGNDARNIALKQKTENQKAKEVDDVANFFCDIIERNILAVASHIRVLISLLLPRYDLEEKTGLSNPNNVRKVINATITSRLFKNSRVTLMNSDTCLNLENADSRDLLMGSDGFHLTYDGFRAMIGNWVEHLFKIIDEAIPDNSKAKPVLSDVHSKPPPPPALEDVPEILASTLIEAAASQLNKNPLVAGSLETPVTVTADSAVVTAATGETVPDPFGTYTAPVNVMSPNRKEGDAENEEMSSSRAPQDTELPSSDTESDGDDGCLPSLETVEPPTSHDITSYPTTNSSDGASITVAQAGSILQEYSNVGEQDLDTLDKIVNPLMGPDVDGVTMNGCNESKHDSVDVETTNNPAAPQEPLKPNFKLGGDGEFIEDDYCSVNGVSDPLPSMINCSGPESTEFAPVSGIFLEDSYLTPGTFESLTISEAKSLSTSDQCKLKSEPEITKKLTENGSDLIET